MRSLFRQLLFSSGEFLLIPLFLVLSFIFSVHTRTYSHLHIHTKYLVDEVNATIIACKHKDKRMLVARVTDVAALLNAVMRMLLVTAATTHRTLRKS